MGEHNTAAEAIYTIQKIHQAEIEYLSRFGHYGDLRELGAAEPGLISQELAAGEIAGYQFSVSPTKVGYAILARSANTEFPSFYSDETLSIKRPALL